MDKPVSAEDAVLRVVNKIAKAEESAETLMEDLLDLQRAVLSARVATGLHYNATAYAASIGGEIINGAGSTIESLAHLHRELKSIADENKLPLPVTPQGGGGGGK